MALPYIISVTTALEDGMKRYGPCAIVSGVNRAGTVIPGMADTSFGAQMRAFDAASGVAIEVPSRNTSYRHQAFRA
eukprot:4356118-Pleurochrysis_carterae.AAC.1